jgi:hypothetical protein
MRQKFMRELYMVESLVRIIYLPFKQGCGDFDLNLMRQQNIIVKVCQKAYRLIKNIALKYYQNELYVSQWINLFFDHAMNTNQQNNIGAEDTIISLVDNNKKLLEIQITSAIVEKIVNLCVEQGRDMQLIHLLKAICSCNGEPIVNNQNDIVKVMLMNKAIRDFLMMPVRMTNNNQVITVDMAVHNPRTNVPQWMPI